jgi:lysyl-tRNA synthetase class 2
MTLKDIILYQHKAYKNLRNFFEKQDFIEVFTPLLIRANTPDPFIDPVFVKCGNPNYKNWQLHTSPELWLKKSLAQGFDKVFSLGKVFRDDISSNHHLIEFTMLEWYRCHSSLSDLIDDCISITAEIARAWQSVSDLDVNMPKKFLVISVAELFKQHADLDLDHILDRTNDGDEYFLVKLLKDRQDYLGQNADFMDAFFHIMLKYIEPALKLDHATIIERWPIQLAALSAPCSDDDRYCDRFEMYFNGLEIANAYKECNDAQILRNRFIRDNNIRKSLNKPVFKLDESFLESVSLLPPMSGIALGVDRLMMSVAKKEHISQIVFGAI